MENDEIKYLEAILKAYDGEDSREEDNIPDNKKTRIRKDIREKLLKLTNIHYGNNICKSR